MNKTAKFKTDTSNQESPNLDLPQNTEIEAKRTIPQKNLQELERYRLLSEKVHDIIWMVRPSGRIIEVNQAAIETYGYSREELLQMNIRDLRLNSEKTLLENHLLQAANGGVQFETVHVCKDGRQFPVEVNATGAEFENERIIMSVVRDITERKKAEKKLRASEERLKFAVQIADFAICEVDYLNNTVQLSAKAAALYGLGNKEITVSRETIHQTFHPEDKNEVMELIEKAANSENGGCFSKDHRILLNNGETRWILVRKQAYFDQTKNPPQPTHAILAAQDITERKRLEERLREKFDELENLYRTAPIGLGLIDREFRFIRINKRLAEINGVSAEDHIGRSIHEIIPDLADEAAKSFRQIFETGLPLMNVELSGETAAHPGIKRTWNESWYPLKDETGKAIAISIVCEEITERKKTEDKLRESEENYRALFDSIDEGFVIIEVIFDENQKAIDFRFKQTNPAFFRLTGLPEDSLGKTVRELIPNLEHFWIENYGRVALTGEPLHLEEESVALNQWFEVRASRMGGDESNRVAVVFNNITKRKIEELNQKLLLRINELIRQTDDEETLFADVVKILGKRLSATRCLFNEVDLVNNIITTRSEYLADENLPSFIGTVSCKKYSEITRVELEKGQMVIVDDTSTDTRTADRYETTYQPQKIGAYISLPLMRDGIWNKTLWISLAEPHQWQEAEISLIKIVAERVWLAAEKLRSERQVRESEERFRIATDAAEMFSWENDIASGKVKWSDNTAKILGCLPEELPENSSESHFFIKKEESERILQEFNNFLSEGKTIYTSEFKGIDNRFWQVHGLVIRDSQGNHIKTIGVTQDITSRKTSEEKIRISEERYRALVEASAQFVWTIRSGEDESSYLDWFAALTEKPIEELKDGGYLKFVHPEDRESLQNLWQQIEKKVEPYEIELRLITKKNKYRHYNLRGVPMFKEDGTLREWIGTVRDITERKSAEESLREAEGFRRLLIENARDYAIVGISIEGIILSWNSGAENIFGYSEKEIIGQSRDVLFTSEDRQMDIPNQEVEVVLKNKNTSYERWHLRKDGSRFFASGVLQELRANDGNLLGFVKIARDQTEKLAAEKAIRDHETLKRVVDALEEERRRIARDLHDELGQQLTALRLKLEHCRKVFSDSQISQEIDEVQAIAKNIDQGVDFIAWQFRPAALDDLGLYAALNKFVHEWSNYSGVKAELLPSSLKNVRFPTQIETNIYRIAQEALNNISKHAKANSAELLLEKRDNLIVLIIADDGIGFDLKSKDVLNKGIGLIGMQERASLIDGRLEIESTLGEGTTIYVRVPQPSSSRK